MSMLVIQTGIFWNQVKKYVFFVEESFGENGKLASVEETFYQ
jgi:hypothetical protein